MIDNFDALERALHDAKDVMSVEMGHLRDALGFKKLSANIVAGIGDELDSRMIGCSPLTTNQHDRVLLYKKGIRIAALIEAVTTADDQAAAVLREFQSQSTEKERHPVRLRSSAAEEPLVELIQALNRAETRKAFVALTWFRNEILPTEGFVWSKTEVERDALLREAIRRRIVLTNKEHNPQNPERPTTSIRLNRNEPVVEAALRGGSMTRNVPFRPLPAIHRGGSLSETIIRERR